MNKEFYNDNDFIDDDGTTWDECDEYKCLPDKPQFKIIKSGRNLRYDNINTKVHVVDMIMGAGKTSAAINFMNKHKNLSNDVGDSTTERFMYITPYLDEVERIRENCKELDFHSPTAEGTKLNSLKRLLKSGHNIVTTHALFKNFDKSVIDLVRSMNYTLIMDEVTDVVAKHDIQRNSLITLSYATYVEEETRLVKFLKSKFDYTQNDDFYDEYRLSELDSLAYYNDSIMVWLFPITAFDAFREIYILTYMFDAQMQKYYYDYYGLSYDYLYVTKDENGYYQFTKDETLANYVYKDYKNLIHIEEHKKLNAIGDRMTDLSKSWYRRNKDSAAITKLKNNTFNFFYNIRKSKTAQNLWTTFSDFRSSIQGKGYSKGFVPCNMRASNDYRERFNVAYLINRYSDPNIKQFFLKQGVTIDEGRYALSEMLQFIWRSAIRDGKEIYLYVPSIRMRTLLEQWLDEMDELYKQSL